MQLADAPGGFRLSDDQYPMTQIYSTELGALNAFDLPCDCARIIQISDPAILSDYLAGLGPDGRRSIAVAGELSNTVLAEHLDGPLLLFRGGGILKERPDRDFVTLRVAGSCPLDALAAHLCGRGVAGMELLSGIPGTVGAGIAQNVGAYGQQVSDHFVAARACDLETGDLVTLTPADFRFAYRSTALKAMPGFTPRYVLLDLDFALPRRPPAALKYGDLVRQHATMERDPTDLAALRQTVLEVRGRKGMVIGCANWVPCAGSFFMSPEVPGETAVAIAERVRGRDFAANLLDWYRPDAASSRVPAALVLRAAGLINGDRWGGLGLSPHHILAVCKLGPATGSDVAMVSRLIQARVRDTLGIELRPEVKFLGALREEPLDAFLARNPLVAGESEPEWARAFGVPGAG